MKVTEHIQSAYEQQYQNDQSAWRAMGARQKAANIRELTAGMPVRKVLEVGAGDGSILQELSHPSFADELYAVEISESARQRIVARNLPQLRDAHLFDGYTLPYPDQTFDLVILSHVLEHVEFERKLLRELQRVAAYQVIEVPKDYRFGVDRNVQHFLAYGHINTYTPSSLRFLLRSEGFRIMKEKISIYSRQTYRYMSAASPLKGDVVYYAKRLLTGLPVHRIRDHFANTITVLTCSESSPSRIF